MSLGTISVMLLPLPSMLIEKARDRMAPEGAPSPSHYYPEIEDDAPQGPVDPGLEACSQPTAPVSDHYSDHQMQRFLSEQQLEAPFAAFNFEIGASDHFPAPHGSPLSQPRSSMVNDSHLSEGDLFCEDPQVPFTPPTVATVSPYMAEVLLEGWKGSPSQFSQGYGTPKTCVDPSEINPAQDNLMDCKDNGFGMDFEFQNSFHFGSSSLSQHPEQATSQPNHLHPLSPESDHAVFEGEIQVYTPHSPVYPDLEEAEDDAKSGSDTDNSTPSHDDGDEDYTPYPQTRASGSLKVGKNPLRKKAAKPPTSSLRGAGRVSKAKSLAQAKRKFSSVIGKKLTCAKGPTDFGDQGSLEGHKRVHNEKIYPCVFDFAGCNFRFATKNEWKRHVASQHLLVTYWLCACPESVPDDCKRPGFTNVSKVFRRKDLFTQHLRRMHTPAALAGLDDTDVSEQAQKMREDWENEIKAAQSNASRKRCEPPIFMQCPVKICSQEFRGEEAWDERMEHVARHHEQASLGKEGPVEYGGDHDETLTKWAEAVNVICRDNSQGCWRLSASVEHLQAQLRRI